MTVAPAVAFDPASLPATPESQHAADKDANNWKIMIPVLSCIFICRPFPLSAMGRHASPPPPPLPSMTVVEWPRKISDPRQSGWHIFKYWTSLHTAAPSAAEAWSPRRPRPFEADSCNAPDGPRRFPTRGLKRRTRRRLPSGPRSDRRPRSLAHVRNKRTQIVSRKADKEDGV